MELPGRDGLVNDEEKTMKTMCTGAIAVILASVTSGCGWTTRHGCRIATEAVVTDGDSIEITWTFHNGLNVPVWIPEWGEVPYEVRYPIPFAVYPDSLIFVLGFLYDGADRAAQGIVEADFTLHKKKLQPGQSHSWTFSAKLPYKKVRSDPYNPYAEFAVGIGASFADDGRGVQIGPNACPKQTLPEKATRIWCAIEYWLSDCDPSASTKPGSEKEDPMYRQLMRTVIARNLLRGEVVPGTQFRDVNSRVVVSEVTEVCVPMVIDEEAEKAKMDELFGGGGGLPPLSDGSDLDIPEPE